MKRYSIIVRPYGADVETETVLCEVDESPEGVARALLHRSLHRRSHVMVQDGVQ